MVWSRASSDFDLESKRVDVWRVELDPLDSFGLSTLLSKPERERASRLYPKLNRSRWISARAVLRILLSRYLRTDPIEIAFELNAFGKPSIKKNSIQGSGDGLQFNLSHSTSLALLAVGREIDLGVDVEAIKKGM